MLTTIKITCMRLNLIILLGLNLLLNPAQATNSQIISLDFQRTQQGSAKVLLGFNKQPLYPQLERTQQGLRLNFAATRINTDLINLYDTNDFATQVTHLDIKQTGAQVEILLAITGTFSYLITQQGQELQLEITPTSPAPITQRSANQGKTVEHYTGELVSLSYHDLPLRSILAELANFLGLSLVVGDSVNGHITLELNSVPSDQALDLVLISQGLASRQQGKVLLVAPAEELIKLEERQHQARIAAANAGDLEESFIKVRYAQAKDIYNFILGANNHPTQPNTTLGAGLITSSNITSEGNQTTAPTKFLSNRGQILVDERTNTLYVRDTPEQITRVQQLVATLDVPIEQVMIEARIVIARNGVSDALGVTWGITKGQNSSSTAETTRTAASNRVTSTKELIASRATSTQFNPDTGFNFGLVSRSLLLDLELAALETENKSEVISQPKVITANRTKAIIRSGEEIPYSSTNTDGERTTNFRQAELRLEVTPQIVGDGRIFLDLQVNNDSKGEETADAGPTINTNAVETQVLVNDGETLVIGGIFTSQNLSYEAKVPFLGDLPLLGWLFRRTFSSQEKVELLVFITPKMLTITWEPN